VAEIDEFAVLRCYIFV